jgi:hypothetical protein
MRQNNPDQALIAFSELATRFPDDPLIRLHHERLQLGEVSDMIFCKK